MTAGPQRSEPILPAMKAELATAVDAVSLMCIRSTGTPSALLATYNYTIPKFYTLRRPDS